MDDICVRIFKWGCYIIWIIALIFAFIYSFGIFISIVKEVNAFVGLILTVFYFFLLCPIIAIVIRVFQDD